MKFIHTTGENLVEDATTYAHFYKAMDIHHAGMELVWNSIVKS